MMSFGLISHDCEFLFLHIIVILSMFPFSSFPLLPHLNILFSCFFHFAKSKIPKESLVQISWYITFSCYLS
jgi:hypothetical protein